MTKHHALVVSRQAPHDALAQDASVQAEADRHRGAVPEFVTEASGKGAVESFTVIYGRNGNVEHGVVMLRTSDNARALARVPAHDGATLAHLLNMDCSPIGSSGDIAGAAGKFWRHCARRAAVHLDVSIGVLAAGCQEFVLRLAVSVAVERSDRSRRVSSNPGL